MKYDDYWDEVAYACRQQGDKLGAFPPPRLATVAAAEVVKLLLKKAGANGGAYAGTMACSVVQLHDLIDNRQTFVVAFSGYHPDLRLDLKKGCTELREAFVDMELSVNPAPRFWYRQAAPSYYVPLHAQTQDYFAKYLDGVDVTKKAIGYADISAYLNFGTWETKVFEGKQRVLMDITTQKVSKVISPTRTIQYSTYTAVYGASTGDFSYAYKGKTKRPKSKDLAKMYRQKQTHLGKPVYEIGDNFDQQKGTILEVMRGMLASFLAIRMDLISATDVPKAVTAARLFIKKLRATGVAHLEKLAAYLEQVLITPKLTSEQIDREVLMTRLRQEQMMGMPMPPEPGPTRLFKRERKMIKRSLGIYYWKDVPTEGRLQATDLVAGRNRLRPPPTGELASARDELVRELRDDELLQDILPHLWAASGAGPNGQFCAEPKAFDHVRNGGLIERGVDEGKSRHVIVGQLALWYSGGDSPRNFSESLLIIGPTNARETPSSGGYMLPCSSCAARSGIMMDGVTVKSKGPLPSLFVTKDIQMPMRCAKCGKATTLRCGRCRAVYYCKVEHQRQDWARHRSLCAPKR